jgi:2-dehydro-3-deoxy-D-arabinonate dehydratase
VPEPELALVFNSRGERVGYTAGNDVSSRDIEGANLLYLPQAKVYDRACALGPWVVVGESEAAARRWTVTLEIRRRGRKIFSGSTPVSRIRRRFADLGSYLFRSQTFARGAVLLTGTGIVPDAPFTLRRGDEVTVAISGVGALVNPVTVV